LHNIEADDQQINLTRFSLFLPEKRLFFQERSSIFNYGLRGNLFYSRRIGLYANDDGDLLPARIFGGVRLIGRSGPWDIGIIDMQQRKTETQPTTNFGVLRLRRQIFNKYSYMGVMVTNKIDKNKQYNTGFGVDGIFRIFENDYLHVNYSQTYQNNQNTGFFDLSHSKIGINVMRRSNNGLGYNILYTRGGKDYNPEMGFEKRNDYTLYMTRFWWTWFISEKSRWLNHRLSFVQGHALRNKNLETETLLGKIE